VGLGASFFVDVHANVNIKGTSESDTFHNAWHQVYRRSRMSRIGRLLVLRK
jgi:hypothetical protein